MIKVINLSAMFAEKTLFFKDYKNNALSATCVNLAE